MVLKNKKSDLKILIYFFSIIRYLGLPLIFRELFQRKKVTILRYHSLDGTSADKHFSYLKRHYNIISLEDFVLCVKDKTKKLPKKALIITFDDGHIKNYDMLPAIKKHGIPVTIFLCANIVGTKTHYWFKHIKDARLKEELKKLPNAKRIEKLRELGFEQDIPHEFPEALQEKQILEMKDCVSFQSHTLTHPILPNCTDEEAKEEITMSKTILEERYGIKIFALSYPNNDYSERDIRLAKNAGYECALTVDYGFNDINTDIFRLKRLCANDSDNISELAVKASGIWGLVRKFVKI